LKRIGFESQVISLKGVEGKIGSGRPASLPPYLTTYCKKQENINAQLLQALKTTTVDSDSGIRLVPFDGSEIKSYSRWFDRDFHSEEMKYQHEKTPYTTDPSLQVPIPEFVDFMIKSPHHVMFRIEHPQYGFVGHVSISGIDYGQMSCWLGYHIGDKEMWGKGIGTQAVGLILDYLKDKDFRAVYSWSHPDNRASVKILEKFFESIGFTEDGLVHYKRIL
jgi:RimJ/RimL family protein N-acetyltransferase